MEIRITSKMTLTETPSAVTHGAAGHGTKFAMLMSSQSVLVVRPMQQASVSVPIYPESAEATNAADPGSMSEAVEATPGADTPDENEPMRAVGAEAFVTTANPTPPVLQVGTSIAGLREFFDTKSELAPNPISVDADAEGAPTPVERDMESATDKLAALQGEFGTFTIQPASYFDPEAQENHLTSHLIEHEQARPSGIFISVADDAVAHDANVANLGGGEAPPSTQADKIHVSLPLEAAQIADFHPTARIATFRGAAARDPVAETLTSPVSPALLPTAHISPDRPSDRLDDLHSQIVTAEPSRTDAQFNLQRINVIAQNFAAPAYVSQTAAGFSQRPVVTLSPASLRTDNASAAESKLIVPEMQEGHKIAEPETPTTLTGSAGISGARGLPYNAGTPIALTVEALESGWMDPRRVMQADALSEELSALSSVPDLVGANAAHITSAISNSNSSATPAPGNHPSQQLAEAVISNRTSQTETELVLTPDELGKVQFTIGQHDGVITISISADRPDTLALLRRHADMLSADLAQAGLGNAALDFGTSDRNRDDKRQARETSQQRSATGESPGIHAGPQMAKRLTGTGRLDLRL